MINNDFIRLGAERLNVKILQIWDNFYMISLQVLTKKKQNTRRVYQDSRSPKIFSLKQKPNKILSAALEEIKFCLFKKTASCYLRL